MGIVGAIGGALIQGSASRSAAKSQEAAANRDIAFQTETRDLIRNDLAPYRGGGVDAQRAYDFELGLAPRPTFGGQPMQIEEFTVNGGASSAQSTMPRRTYGDNRPGAGEPGSVGTPEWLQRLQNPMGGAMGGTPGAAGGTRFRVGGQEFATREEAQAYANANRTGGMEYGGFTKTPGYDFRLQSGMDSLNASHAARSGILSGAAVRDGMQFGQNFASNEYGNYLSRLGGRADTGMSAAQMSGAASQQAAAGVGNALGNFGNARAAGAIGMGNALTGGIQNVAGVLGYQQGVTQAGNAPNGFNMFGGIR